MTDRLERHTAPVYAVLGARLQQRVPDTVCVHNRRASACRMQCQRPGREYSGPELHSMHSLTNFGAREASEVSTTLSCRSRRCAVVTSFSHSFKQCSDQTVARLICHLELASVRGTFGARRHACSCSDCVRCSCVIMCEQGPVHTHLALILTVYVHHRLDVAVCRHPQEGLQS